MVSTSLFAPKGNAISAPTIHLLILCSLLLVLSCCSTQEQEEKDVDFPPIIDSDDIAYFFSNRDLDGLHWALQNVFRRSSRNPDRELAVPLPDRVVSRGGGVAYTSAYKLQHDLEQAVYLGEHLGDEEEAGFFRNVVAPAYKAMLERIPPMEDLQRTQGLYSFKPADQEQTKVHLLYNKALHLTNLDQLKDDDGNNIPLINPALDASSIQNQWFGEKDSPDHPGIITVDNLLSPQALAAIQKIMLESTVWYQTKLPLRFGGYVGAYIDDGLHDRILLELSLQLHDFLPRIFQGHPLRYLWAYKYDADYSGIKLHADQAAVNVNIWLTPNDANLHPESGGLVVFTAKPPADWEFARFNTDTDFVRSQLLEPTGFANVTIPYRTNRAVIFDSALFHQTDNFQFRKGYKKRRINLTILYGSMDLSSTQSHASVDKEL
jgi:hypothetical protein